MCDATGHAVFWSVFKLLFFLHGQLFCVPIQSRGCLSEPSSFWSGIISVKLKNVREIEAYSSWLLLVLQSESLIIHSDADEELLFWLPWNSNNGFTVVNATLDFRIIHRTSLKIKLRRNKCPCAYYANSGATFHLILDVGDLVFKLNPGPDNKITTIVSSYRASRSHVRRPPSNFHLNSYCSNPFNSNGHLQSRYCFPRGASLHNLRSLKRVSLIPEFLFNRQFISCLIKARSVCNKTLIIKDFVVDYKVDLLGITETWLHMDGCDATIGELCPSGYRLLHTPRSIGRGGGVGILYKQGISTKVRLCEHSFMSFECIDITFVARKSLRAIVVYRPPEGTSVNVFLEEFSSLLQETAVCPEELLIFGDFNFHMDNKDDGDATRFGDLLDLFNLKQHVCVPTHKRGHILDLVITRNNSGALNLKNVTVMEQLISDHKAICLNLNLQKPLNIRKTVVSRKLKGFDFNAFNEMIESSGLLDEVVAQSVESLTKEYDEVLCKVMNKLAPVKSRTIVIRPNAPWYNEEIANQKRKRRRLERKWRSTGLERDKGNYVDQCHVVNSMLYKAKEQYYSAIIKDNAHDSKLLFRTVDKLLQKNTEKRYPFANCDQELANGFADFFSAKIDNIRNELIVRKDQLCDSIVVEPECASCFSEFAMVSDKVVLELISGSTIKSCALDPLPASVMQKCYSRLVPVFRRVINLSRSSGTMPNDLKIAMLLPLLKKLNADFEQFTSFRPVSNLKFLSKLVEKAVYVQLNNYLGKNDLHEPLQSAYKIFHSTETALLTVTNDIMLSLDKGDSVFLVLLDLSAAFDTVNHSLLLARLKKSFGITGTVLQWFNSYLSNRTQFVNINKANSTVRDLSVGVPQGSVLGPVLYLLYTAPLAEVIRSYGLDYHLYADDTQLYFSFKSMDVDAAKSRVEGCVSAICRWMNLNELKLNHAGQDRGYINTLKVSSPSILSVFACW